MGLTEKWSSFQMKDTHGKRWDVLIKYFTIYLLYGTTALEELLPASNEGFFIYFNFNTMFVAVHIHSLSSDWGRRLWPSKYFE